jgi:alkylated DNA repair dioxygenase AlkB
MQSPPGLREWTGKSLGALLGQPPEQLEEIVENILTFDDASELVDFLGNFADEAGSKRRIESFVTELFERKKPPPTAGAPKSEDGPSGGRGKGRGKGRGRGGGDDGIESRRRSQEDFPRMMMPMREKNREDKRLMQIDAASGRHNVLTNCLNCGKIVTESEGWGPCLFCGNPLEVGDAFGLRSGDDRGYMAGALTAAEEDRYNASFEKAKETKDRLLSYDRDAKKRTQVYDDSTDWYTEKDNIWLTERQREEASRRLAEEERKQREDKRKIHAKIDLFGRTVIDASAEVEKENIQKARESYEAWQDKVVDENKLLAMYESNQKGMGGHISQLSSDSQSLYDRLRASLHETGKQLQKEQKSEWGNSLETTDYSDAKKNTRWDASGDVNRIENEFTHVTTSVFAGAAGERGLQLLPEAESPYTDADDTGQCLSMHQPWATLLVHGFKRAEGRNWKHGHRGRLWIHAAGTPPEPSKIAELESRYRKLYESLNIPIPKMPSESSGYPTSALLGCIDVEAQWSQDEFRAVKDSNPAMPPEENDDDFIFWCLRSRRLIVPLKMGGDKKIWQLPVSSMRAAQRGLQPVRWPAPDEGQSYLCSPDIASPQPTSTRVQDDPSDMAEEKPTASAAKTSTGMAPAAKAAQRPKVPSRPPHLDLWPAESTEERLQVVERDRSSDRDVVVLQDGFVQLVGFVPPDIQQRIVDEMREIGTSSKGFFEEQFDGVKVSKEVSRMYLGMHWNAQAQRWDTARSNLDGEPAAEIPKFLLDMYSEAVKRANRELVRGPNKKRKLVPFPEGRAPSLAVANFFQPSGTMQIHQDRTESKDAIAAGFPVMGICIGDSCDFPYGIEQPTASQKPKTVRLESGDVYLFGGPSRMLWHGVSRVLPRSAPPSLRLLPGRLSVSLRVH